MPATINKSVAAPAAVVITNLNLGPVPDNIAVVEVSGTFSSITATFQGTADGTNFANLPGVRLDTLAIENTPTVSNNTTRQWKIDITGMQQFQFNVTAVTGTIVVQINTTYNPGGIQVQLSSAGSLAAGAVTITSTSSNALAVGRQGTTNPVLQVNASTSSVADGIEITGAAAGSGVALLGITSGTNAPITIDAAGSGTIALNNVSGTGNVILGDAINLQLQTTTGTKIATATTQKLAFWNATPIVQPTNATDLYTMLVNVGLIASGGTPAFSPPGAVNIADGQNVVLATTTGSKIGTATTQKLGFYNVTPVVQPAAATGVTTGTTGASTGVSLDTTFKGASGSSAYTITGIVTSLKALGLLAA